MLLIVFIALIQNSYAHMSLSFPKVRNVESNGVNYPTWKSNEPMWPARPSICHGLPAKPVLSVNEFAAGETINVRLAGTVPHAGGHCSFWYSLDDVTFTKIVDVKDCSLHSGAEVQLPSTMPKECESRCTFAWTWVPRLSAVCEVYSNCADISVSGLSGATEANPQTYDFRKLLREGTCQRVNDYTHWTSLFRPLKLAGSTAIEPPTTPDEPEDTDNTGNPGNGNGNPGNGNGNPSSCAGLDEYDPSGTAGYTVGHVVGCSTGNLGQYECKVAGWCNQAAWAYSPCSGHHWNMAWTKVGSCSSAHAVGAVFDVFDGGNISSGMTNYWPIIAVSIMTLVNVTVLVWRCMALKQKRVVEFE